MSSTLRRLGLIGLLGMPRRYIDYPEPFAGWNALISYGSYIGAVALVWGLGVFVYTLLFGRRVTEPNYWGEGATTLEWAIPTPPPYHTFSVLPRIG